MITPHSTDSSCHPRLSLTGLLSLLAAFLWSWAYPPLAIASDTDPPPLQWALERVGNWGDSKYRDMEIADGHAYGVDCAGLDILDVSTPTAPARLSRYTTPGCATDVALSGHYAYVADGNRGLLILDIGNPAAPVFAGRYATANEALKVAVSGRYAHLYQRSTGVEIIDIGNPAAPQAVGAYPEIIFASAIVLAGSYAYIAGYSSSGVGGLQVFDIRNPAAPVRVAEYQPWSSARDAVLAGQYLYLAADSLHIVDISNPLAPVLTGIYSNSIEARKVLVSGHYAYVMSTDIALHQSQGTAGLKIIDVSNPAVPILAGGTANLELVAVVDHYVYRSREIIDVSNPAAPTLAGTIQKPLDRINSSVIVGHHAYLVGQGISVLDLTNPLAPARLGQAGSEHFYYHLAISGHYAYATYSGGVSVFDIGNPAEPVFVVDYPSASLGYRIAIAGHYAYVTSPDYDLFILDISDPAAPVLAASYAVRYPQNFVISGNRLYLIYIDGVQILDIGNPVAPVQVMDIPDYPHAERPSMTVTQGYLYLGSGNTLKILDMSNPAQPVVIGNYTSRARITQITVAEPYAYLAVENGLQSYLFPSDYPPDGGVEILDLSNPAAPQLIGAYPSAQRANSILLYGGYIYFKDGDNQWVILNAQLSPAVPVNPDLSLSLPRIRFGAASAWANLAYGGNGLFQVTAFGTPGQGESISAVLTDDLLLQIPCLTYAQTPLWANLHYQPSDGDKLWFKLSAYGNRNEESVNCF